MPTPHNAANPGDIAATVLMPGDPLRAKLIAETYLEDVKCFNTVRGMLGFTGTYKGKRLSVMGSGMGMPSMGIYSYELFTVYDVQRIIRIGSMGAYCAEAKLRDVMLVTSAWSQSTFARVQNGCEDDVLFPGEELTGIIRRTARAIGQPLLEGRIHSTDVFYTAPGAFDFAACSREKGCLGVEMESFALFHNASACGKEAACLATVSDSFVSEEKLSAEERQTSFDAMMRLALEAAIV